MFPTFLRREDPQRRSSPRHTRLRATFVALTLASSLLGATTMVVAQAPSSRPFSPGPAAFTAIDPAAYAASSSDSVAPDSTLSPAGEGSIVDFADIADFAPRERSSTDARAAFGQPESAAADAEVKSVAKLPPTRLRARGDASWYCVSGVSACHRDYGPGLYAAAGAELRVGDWRGRSVTVCAGDDCIRVKLVDWCACPGDRVIDLYGDAFRRLAPLDTGIVRVSVRW